MLVRTPFSDLPSLLFVGGGRAWGSLDDRGMPERASNSADPEESIFTRPDLRSTIGREK